MLTAFLDLSAAFDTIDHEILSARFLQPCFGVESTVLTWFNSYITERKQFVPVLGSDSEPIPLLFGVTQGYVLGLILFTMYTKPLSDFNDC